MEFQASGNYFGIHTTLLWRDGDLTGQPSEVVDDIKAKHAHDGVELGGQFVVFDLTDFETAHNFITGKYLTDTIVTGDMPPEDAGRIY